MSIKDNLESEFSKLNERLDINFALKAAGLGVWEIDLTTDMVTLDNRCRELFGGLEGNHLSYQQILERIDTDDVENVRNSVRTAIDPESDGLFNITFHNFFSDTLDKVFWKKLF